MMVRLWKTTYLYGTNTIKKRISAAIISEDQEDTGVSVFSCNLHDDGE